MSAAFAVAEAPWRAGPAAVPFAAPLAAIDAWRPLPAADGAWAAESRTAVDGGHPALRGHFPGLVVFPGIYTMDTLGQLVAVAVGDPTGAGTPLRAVRSLRFLATLLDGDELTLEATGTPRPEGGWAVRAVGRRGDGGVVARLHADYGDPTPPPATPSPATPSATTPAAPTPAAPTPPATPPAPLRGTTAAAVGDGSGGRAQPEIRAVLPQRHPLLLVDRVLGRSADAIVTAKAVSATEPCYAHLPDGAPPHAYEYPRSLLVESFGQSAALLWLDGAAPTADDGRVLMFVGARDVRFEGVARPGDVLRHEVALESVLADTAFACGETWAGDRRIATFSSLIATRRAPRPSGAAPATAGAGHRLGTSRTEEGTR